MPMDLVSSVSSPASILLLPPPHTPCSTRKGNGLLRPPQFHGCSVTVTCETKFPTDGGGGTGLSRKVPLRLNKRDSYSMVPRSTDPSSSGGSSEEPMSSTGLQKVPFGYTRKDVLLIGLGVTLLGIGLKSGLEFLGVDPLKAGNVVQLVLVLGLTVGWISTYIFRVSNKDMTYAKQLKDYESKVMEKRLEGLTEAELVVLMEQVEEEKRRIASGEQV